MKRGWLVVIILIFIFGSLGYLVFSRQVNWVEELSSESREQQLVYTTWAFTGQRYDSVFYPQSEETIYLIADVDNVITPKLTEVYYWSLSMEYRPDWTELDEKLTGVVKITQDEKVVATLAPIDYSLLYSNLIPHSVATGSHANDKYQAYLEETRQVADELDAYYQESIQYQIAYENYLNEIKQGNLDAVPPELPPDPPPTSQHYVSKPENAYHINLPAGDYELELRTLEGNLVQTSRKRLHVFAPRQQSIGYKVFVSERWTQPDIGADPQDVFYVSPGESIFIQPYFAQEFRRYDYAKLREPQQSATGRYAWQWVLTNQIEGGQLQIKNRNTQQQVVPFESYFVRQNPGPTLGYEIDHYDAEVAQGNEPTFSAFEFTVSDNSQIYQFALMDSSGELLQDSARVIRVLTHVNLSLLYMFAILPLVLGVVYSGFHRFRIRRQAVNAEIEKENLS